MYIAVRVLKEASELYCEDTRRTGILLSHYKIERKGGLTSFHDHSPSSVLAKIKETVAASRLRMLPTEECRGERSWFRFGEAGASKSG